MNRREAITTGMVLGAASLIEAPPVLSQSDNGASSLRIIDTNVSLFHWPFRRLPMEDPPKLADKLASLGIAKAWAGSFEGLLHRDLSSVNQRLAETCARHPIFVPIGSINPELPGWEVDLRRCLELHRMPGIRLHPNYHGYTLDDPRVGKLIDLTTKAGGFLQIVSAAEDLRTQHPKVQVPEVDLAPLLTVLPAQPEARVQILNLNPRRPLLDKLAALPGVSFDTARVESTDGVPKLLRGLPAGRLMYGSHAPFLIPEAALIRVHESGQLEESELHAVFSGNANTFSARRKP